MTVALTNSDVTTLVFVAIFALLLGRRIVAMVRGTPVRPERMFAFAALFAAVFVLVLLTSASQLPPWTYAVDAAIAVVSTVGSAVIVRRRVVMEWRDGRWFYRLGAVIPALYLGLFALRLALDTVVLGVNPFGGAPGSPVPLSGTALLTVVVIDVLFAFSTGLLVGRTIGVYLRYREKLAAGPPTEAGRLASGPQ
jgi:hypothetical protein